MSEMPNADDPRLYHPVRLSWVNKEHRIEVYEASNGFYITDLDSSETKGMGDGVDMFGGYDIDGQDGEAGSVLVGTPKFYELMAATVADDGAMLREAYFGGSEE